MGRLVVNTYVVIKRPLCSGSLHYNYKIAYSIILIAMVDEGYCFTYVDTGGNGRASDSAVLEIVTLKWTIKPFLRTLLSLGTALSL